MALAPSDPRDDLARLEPYLGEIAEACLLEGEDVALLCAIGLRETWFTWAPGYSPRGSILGRGDGGHGFGPYQIDNRGRYGHLPRECPEATAFLQTRWVCQVLRDARAELQPYRDHPQFERAVCARYNASFERVRIGLEAGDPDIGTTPSVRHGPGDYGKDVLRRRDWLRENYPDRFPPARRSAGT